jgi:deazaflavin-dependent oxidoreductase (nitroreductase family)
VRTGLKHRLVRTVEKYLVNPPVKAALAVGIPMPLTLLETTGRRTGRPRRTVVADGRVADTVWVVAEHGQRAAYVGNLLVDPQVRVKLGRRWATGTAQVLPDDDPYARAEWIADQRWRSPWVERWITKMLGVGPVTVRIDLALVDGQSPSRRDAPAQRLHRDKQLGVALVVMSGALMAWAGYLFAVAGINAALLASIVPGITIELAYAAYRRVDRATGRLRPTGWNRLAQEATGLGAGLLMAVGGYAAARWNSSVAAAAIILGLPAIGAAIVLGRAPRVGPATAEPELVG